MTTCIHVSGRCAARVAVLLWSVLAAVACSAEKALAPYGVGVTRAASDRHGGALASRPLTVTAAESALAEVPRCVPPVPVPAAWRPRPLRILNGMIALPPALTEDRVVGVEPLQSTAWVGADSSGVVLIVDQSGDPAGTLTRGFDDAGGRRRQVDEGTCAGRVAGRLARVWRTGVVRVESPGDTLFMADFETVLRDDVLASGLLFSRTRAGREDLLGALAGLRLNP